MEKYQLHRQFFSLIAAMMSHGVVVYGYGRNGKRVVSFCEAAGIPVRAIYDKNVNDISNSGRVRPSSDIPSSEDHDAVCILTPARGGEDIFTFLQPYYSRIARMDDVRWLMHMLPIHYEEQEISYLSARPFDFYESPYASPQELVFADQMREEDAFSEKELDWNLAAQQAFCSYLWKISEAYEADLHHFPRYQAENGMFDKLDGLVLYGMLLREMPRRIIEIGSGWSTKLSMDTSGKYAGGKVAITCIEPYPERLLSGLSEHAYERVELTRTRVQNVDLTLFEALEPGDILFIDSSHVVKTGGDIPFELFRILPRLRRGVRLHFHDIFYPFTYPEPWVRQGRPYTEAYALRALLTRSDAYEMLYFSDMMIHLDYTDAIKMRERYKNYGTGSFWMRKR